MQERKRQVRGSEREHGRHCNTSRHTATHADTLQYWNVLSLSRARLELLAGDTAIHTLIPVTSCVCVYAWWCHRERSRLREKAGGKASGSARAIESVHRREQEHACARKRKHACVCASKRAIERAHDAHTLQQHTATHCNTLQYTERASDRESARCTHTATQCNRILQHTERGSEGESARATHR